MAADETKNARRYIEVVVIILIVIAIVLAAKRNVATLKLSAQLCAESRKTSQADLSRFRGYGLFRAARYGQNGDDADGWPAVGPEPNKRMKSMKLLIASIVMALVLASPLGWAASGTDISVANGSAAEDAVQKLDHTMLTVMPASQIVGRDLKDAQGIDAGKINSLVIDTKSGAVEFVMITAPTSLNADNRLIAAPWAALDPPATANGSVTTKFSVDKLAKAPRIDPRLMFELSRPEMRDRMYGFYGADFPGSSGTDPDNRISGAGEDSQNELGARDRHIDLAYQNNPKPPSATNQEQPTGSSALVFAEDGVIAKLEALTTTSTGAMHDSDIYDSKGKDVGEFNETMIDVNRGQVAYVLVSHGGFLGMDENLYVVPIEALSISPYRTSYRLTVNAQILEGEPALHAERGHLPSRVSAAQLAILYQRFGVQPYWSENPKPASLN